MEGRPLEVMQIPRHMSVVTGLFVYIVSDCERGPTRVEIEASFFVYQDEDAERCLVPELLAVLMFLLGLLSVFCCLTVTFCTKCI
jgi:hypothetical protein